MYRGLNASISFDIVLWIKLLSKLTASGPVSFINERSVKLSNPILSQAFLC